MTLAAARTKRERLDGPLTLIGVTKDDHLGWLVDHAHLRWTPDRAVRTARNKVQNSRDGLVQLDGLWLNESDLDSMCRYLSAHSTATIARCKGCDGPCAATDAQCSICIHEITEFDE